MGSKGQKPRKRKGNPQQHTQHLAKVGSKTETERLMHSEHQAMADTMGMGGMSAGAKAAIAVIGIVLLAAAIFGLIVLN